MTGNIRASLSSVKNKIKDYIINFRVKQRLSRVQVIHPENFYFVIFRQSILAFLLSKQSDDTGYKYYYSSISTQSSLYASSYACMTLFLIVQLQELSNEDEFEWLQYFDRFQNNKEGSFYDPVVANDLYDESDWWGARHLALHMISAYTDLGGKPKYPFYFLRKYYKPHFIRNWLNAFDWSSAIGMTDDIDNTIMNVGCLLQYQRDTWQDEQAGQSLAYLQRYLLQKLNPQTGMWGSYDTQDSEQCSRMVQFAYHLFPLFFYDQIPIQYPDKIIDYVLATQNQLGGFGVKLNSSACEDIDSIDLLCRLAGLVPSRKKEIDNSLKAAFRWVLCNQVSDGGFVFRLYEPFVYGHKQMASQSNQGSMFSTWFRILSLAYMERYFNRGSFKINFAPGLTN